MKWRKLIVISVCALPLVASAQTGGNTPSPQPYVPRLGDIMNTAQTRHIKLWLADKSANWDLAAYEIRQLKTSLAEAALLYEGIPVTKVTTMAEPIQALTDAIEAKDAKKFTRSYGDLTERCNDCHRSMGRGFIIMRVPEVSPFADQRFAPEGKR
jgi:hypothetical protein